MANPNSSSLHTPAKQLRFYGLKFSVFGTVEAGFESVEQEFIRNFTERNEVGASICVYVNGKCVVDLWGGWAVKPGTAAVDGQTRIWESNTLANLYSSTKGLANLCLLLLCDRGLANLDDPVCQHWPGFAANGKQGITIAELLSHQAGLAYFDVNPSIDLAFLRAAQTARLRRGRLGGSGKEHLVGQERLSANTASTVSTTTSADDADLKLLRILEQQKPNWKLPDYMTGFRASPADAYVDVVSNDGAPSAVGPSPNIGTVFGYHPLSIGLYVAELVRRIDPKGRSIREYFRDEIAQPFSIDFHMGLTLDSYDRQRVARLYPESVLVEDQDVELRKAIISPDTLTAKAFRAIHDFSPWKASDLELPSAVGLGTARGLARIYGALANGGILDDKHMLSNTTVVREGISKAAEGFDMVLRMKRTYSKAGFHLEDAFPGSFSHGGAGGSIGWGDMKYRLGLGFATNSLVMLNVAPRRDALITSVYKALRRLSTDPTVLSKL